MKSADNFRVIDYYLNKRGLHYDRLRRLLLRILSINYVNDPRGLSNGPRFPALILLELVRDKKIEVLDALYDIISDFKIQKYYITDPTVSTECNGFLFALNDSLSFISQFLENRDFNENAYKTRFRVGDIVYEVTEFSKILRKLLDKESVIYFNELLAVMRARCA
jgi:superfamily II RNA helicase